MTVYWGNLLWFVLATTAGGWLGGWFMLATLALWERLR